MRWIAGWHPSAARPGPRPRNAEVVAVSPAPVWAMDYQPAQVRRVTQGPQVSLMVFGSCLAFEHELTEALEDVRAGRWERLMGWPGSYCAIAQNATETVVLGDLAGRERIYYTLTMGGVLWANAATPVAAQIGARVNWPLLALEIAVAQVDAYCDQTPFEGVATVAPGSLLRIDSAGHVRVQRWFDRPAPVTFPAAVAALRELLTDAMRRRCGHDPQLGSDLSGVDSGTLAALAARYGSLTAFTYADPWTGTDDLDHATSLAAACGIEHRVVTGGVADLTYGQLADLESLPRTDLPSLSAVLHGPREAVIDAAGAARRTRQVDGVGGDAVLSATSLSYVGLYRSGRQFEALRAMAAFARHRGSSPVKAMRRMVALAHTGYGDSLRATAREIAARATPNRSPGPGGYMGWAQPTVGASWLTRDAARWVSERLLQAAEEDGMSDPPEERCVWNSIRSDARDLAGIAERGRALGLVTDSPYMDPAILETCLAVPGWERIRTDRFKPLVTEGLADLLPAAVTRRTTKATLDYSLGASIEHSAAPLREITESSVLVERGVLSRPAVRDARERMIDGSDYPVSMNTLLAREKWARDLDTRRCTYWEEP